MTVNLASSSADSIDTGRTMLTSSMRISVYISVITAIIGIGCYAVLTQLSPRYRAEATILIDAADPAAKGIDAAGSGLGQQLVAAQSQLLRSRDLARTVMQSLGLEHRPAVVSALDGGSMLSDFLSGMGLRRDSGISREEQILDGFAAHLSVHADAPVIAVAFSSTDPVLSADVANAVAAQYVALQQAASRGTDDETTSRLETEIARLRRHLKATETKIEAYRAGIARLSGSGSAAADPVRRQRAEAQLRHDLNELESDAASQRATLESSVQRHREIVARRQGGFLPVDARILSAASAPPEPYFPQKGPITAIVGALALVAMLVFVFVREIGQARRRQRVVEVPLPEVVDARPAAGKAHWNDDGARRMMPAMPTSADTAADSWMRDSMAAISLKLISDKAKRIAVVTVGGEVGKRRPLAAVSLCRALARAERRPVLIDLRDDGADSLGMGGAADLPGFSDLFAGEASFGKVIFRDRASRVHFIPAGLRPLSRQDLADGHIGLLVSALDHTYDHVVFDVASDSVEAIASECAAAVVVTEFDRDDPRTVAVVRRVRLNSQAKIAFVGVPPEEAPTADFEAAVDHAAA